MTIQQTLSPAIEAFGIAIKEARLAREWPLWKLALEALGNEDRKGYCSQVEKGRRKLSEGTILNFARALDLPATATDPLLGNVLPPSERDSKTDDIVSALLKEAEDLRKKLKLSEALAIALAYKYADGNPTDINGALQGLEAALALAAEEQGRGQLPSNYEDAVNDIVARVNALNDAGEVDEAYTSLKEEAERRKDERERRVAEDGRVLELLITQAIMTNDAGGFADAHLERIKLVSFSAEETFDQLYAVFVEQYEDGLQFGTPFSLAGAAGLGRKCEVIAPNSYLRGMILSDLATVFQIQGSRTSGAKRDKLLANSVHKYQEALLLRTVAEYPVEWGMTMQNLANTLARQGISTSGSAGVELLEDSVKGYRAALRVRTKTKYPFQWAMTMQNLGNSLMEVGIRTSGRWGITLLDESIECFQAALRVRKETDHPEEWAETMQNLGLALTEKGFRTSGPEGASLLAASVTSYRAALRVQTEAEYPIPWAMTMQNLGNALRNQGTCTSGREGGLLLTEAADHYSEVIRVLSEADHPVDWAMTQFNMAMVEGTRAEHDSTNYPNRHLELALFHVENALRVYDPQHLGFYYEKAASLRDQILSLLHSPSS